MNNIVTEMINTLKESIAEYLEQKTWINDLEDILSETSAMEQNEEKRMRRTEHSCKSWDNTKKPTFTLQRCQEEKGER